LEGNKKKAKSRQEIKRLYEGTRANFEVLTAVMMKVAAFWDIITGRLVHTGLLNSSNTGLSYYM
jgi:hypothetical protein